MIRIALPLSLLLAGATPAAAHDLSQHIDLPYLAADCAGYWRAVALKDGGAKEPMRRANAFLAAARAQAEDGGSDLPFVVENAQHRAEAQMRDATTNEGARQALDDQETFCRSVGAALPAKWQLAE
ncbi:hypothetical protein [Vannielia sp.]|uniref:hypothetical protein n=1 Tax=Vannielia sp. TaxID=2813045 RepID=UPI0026028E4D|nr:hypothetical protein [Vannielia sp.]MDF1873922.1 hypothetical protein [Vannielia sp.]